jgi:hypothetical protein
MFYKRIGVTELDTELDTEPVKEKKPHKVNRPRVRIKKADVLKKKETDKSLCHEGAVARLRLKNIQPRVERV